MQSLVLGLYDPLLALMLMLMLKTQGYASGTFGLIVSCTATGAICGAVLFQRFYIGQGGLRVMALALSGFGATILVPGVLTCFDQAISLYLMLALWLLLCIGQHEFRRHGANA
jgi:uncharacterized membrane protein YeaQ/YmgE (transglycosylase-associated protein family)